MNTPKLRFTEFTDDWNSGKIGDFIAEIKHGASINPNEYGQEGVICIPKKSITSGGIVNIDESLDFVSEEFAENHHSSVINNEYLVTTLRDLVPTAPNIGYISEIKGFENQYFLLCQGVYGLKLNERLVSEFLIQISNTDYYRKTMQLIKVGSTQVHIRSSEFLNVIINVPSIEEQKKVGKFFTQLDKKIQLQQEKINLLKEQKKGYLQKIFSQEVRFRTEDGREYPKWSLQKLSNFTERVTRKNSELVTTRPLTISAQHGLIDQTEFFNKTVASENLTGYYLLNKGEFAYNKSYSNGYPFGAIKRLDDYENGALSTLYICFTPKDNVNSGFLVHYFDSSLWHKEVSLISVEGARNHGLLNVSVSDFFGTLHYLPCLEEQLKIAKFFDYINQKIKLNEETLKYLQDQKKAFMQQMFI